MLRAAIGAGEALAKRVKRSRGILGIFCLIFLPIALIAIVRWLGFLPLVLGLAALVVIWRTARAYQRRRARAVHAGGQGFAPVTRNPGAVPPLPAPRPQAGGAAGGIDAASYGALFNRVFRQKFVSLNEHELARYERDLRDFGAIVPGEPELLRFHQQARAYLRARYATEIRDGAAHAASFQRHDPAVQQRMEARIEWAHARELRAKRALGREIARLQAAAPELVSVLGPAVEYLTWFPEDEPDGEG
jgi:hypothetical protein